MHYTCFCLAADNKLWLKMPLMNSLLTVLTQGCKALWINNTPPTAPACQTTSTWMLSRTLWTQWFGISHFWLIMLSGKSFVCVCIVPEQFKMKNNRKLLNTKDGHFTLLVSNCNCTELSVFEDCFDRRTAVSLLYSKLKRKKKKTITIKGRPQIMLDLFIFFYTSLLGFHFVRRIWQNAFVRDSEKNLEKVK